MTEFGPSWLLGPDTAVLDRVVLSCAVGGAGHPETFLAWVPGMFYARRFDRTLVAAADALLVRPTARFWWVQETVQDPGGVVEREGIAFQRPGVESAREAFRVPAGDGAT